MQSDGIDIERAEGDGQITALPTIVGLSVGLAMLLSVGVATWRARTRRVRAFRDAASARCRPGRWRADD